MLWLCEFFGLCKSRGQAGASEGFFRIWIWTWFPTRNSKVIEQSFLILLDFSSTKLEKR